MSATCVPKLYRTVIDDVINSIREHFLDEGVDEQILQELKQGWEKKVLESKAVEPKKPDQVTEHHVFPITGQPLQSVSQVPQPAQQISLPSGNIQTYPYNSDIIHRGQKTVTITLPTQGGHGPIQTVLSPSTTTATLALPPEILTASLFPHALHQGTVLNNAQTLQSDNTSTRIQYQPLNAEFSKQQQFTVAIGQPPVSSHPIQKQTSGIIQLDGTNDTSDDDDDEDSHEEAQDEDEEQNEDEDNEEEEEPLNSDDDVSDEDATELFYTENVVVCQYDKITRTRNRWKFHLKDGIMNLKGKDYLFQKANGDAEW